MSLQVATSYDDRPSKQVIEKKPGFKKNRLIQRLFIWRVAA